MKVSHIIYGLAISAVALLALPLSSAHAERMSDSPSLYESPMDFFVYAREGETVDISFSVETALPTSCTTAPGVLTHIEAIVSGPKSFTFSARPTPAQLQVTTPASYSFTAPTEGIYKIQYSRLTFSAGTDIATICPGVPVLGEAFDRSYIDISVLSAATPPATPVAVSGRLFANEWKLYTRGRIKLEFFAMRDDGYRYRVTQNDFDGVYFSILADAFGASALGEEHLCKSGYASYGYDSYQATGDDPLGAPVSSDCGGRFRIYANSPDPTMPATTTNWDDTTTWLFPSDPQRPARTGQSYEQTSEETYAGILDLTISNYYGNAFYLIDTNGNGKYDDPVDRRIQFGVTHFGKATVEFDGRDGEGDIIPLSRTITGAIELNAVGEIHFVATDVEYRKNIEVIRLNGAGTDEDKDLVFWNDTLLANNRYTPFTANVGGTFDHSVLGVHSSASDDVHGWCPNSTVACDPGVGIATYGDIRLIDDWTYDVVTTEYLRTDFIAETASVIPVPTKSTTPSPTPPSVPNTGFWAELSSALFERHLWTLIFVPIAIFGGYTVYKHIYKARSISIRNKNTKEKE